MWESNVQNVRRKHPRLQGPAPPSLGALPCFDGGGAEGAGRRGPDPILPRWGNRASSLAGTGSGGCGLSSVGSSGGSAVSSVSLVSGVSPLPPCLARAKTSLHLREPLRFKAPDPSRDRGSKRGGAGQRYSGVANSFVLPTTPQAALAILSCGCPTGID